MLNLFFSLNKFVLKQKNCTQNMRSKTSRVLMQLSCEHWLMILAFVLLLLAFRCPTQQFVEYNHVHEDFVSCSPMAGHCQLPLAQTSSSMLIKRVVDEALLANLSRQHQSSSNRSGFPLIRAPTCESAFRTAIIVPYRNRAEHLNLFLQHMHPFLRQQNIDYSIYVIEQSERHGFNRGKLLNIGFNEASRDADYCCFIFHDVDLLPENTENLYVCSNQPRHMCVSIDKFRYVVPYAGIFGGVIAMQKEHFRQVNGFSNRFFAWGAEDDDLALRIQRANLRITRWPMDISRYTMLAHERAVPSPERFDRLAESESLWRKDGLVDLKYKLLSQHRTALYTKITVDVNP